MPQEQFGPTTEQMGIKTQETIEQKRKRFESVITIINKDPRLLTQTEDILKGKNVPNLFSNEEPKDTIFLAQTVTRTREKSTRKGTRFGVGERTSVTLQPVPLKDKALLVELLSLPGEEQVALGVPASVTQVDETTTENRFRTVLSTAGELMRYLVDERE